MAPRGCPEPKKPKLCVKDFESDYVSMAVSEMPPGTTFINGSHAPETIKSGGGGNFALYQKVNIPSAFTTTPRDCRSRSVSDETFANSFAVNLRNGNVYNLSLREGAVCGRVMGYIVSTEINFQFDKR